MWSDFTHSDAGAHTWETPLQTLATTRDWWKLTGSGFEAVQPLTVTQCFSVGHLERDDCSRSDNSRKQQHTNFEESVWGVWVVGVRARCLVSTGNWWSRDCSCRMPEQISTLWIICRRYSLPMSFSSSFLSIFRHARCTRDCQIVVAAAWWTKHRTAETYVCLCFDSCLWSLKPMFP